jgi:uncharacterized protein (TIGR00730 family)
MAERAQDELQRQAEEVEARKSVLNDYSAGACGKHVTVYCWSSTVPGSERWQQAEHLGASLVRRGFGIVTGGYCGSMEAISKGAREARAEAGIVGTPAKPHGAQPHSWKAEASFAEGVSPVRGVLVPGQFPDRVLCGNAYLTESVDTASLLARLDVLSSLTRYYIALPGTLGTLTEIAIIWSLAVLHKKDAATPVILLFRDPWEAAMTSLQATLALPAAHMAALRYVDSVEECVAIIEQDYTAQMNAERTK